MTDTEQFESADYPFKDILEDMYRKKRANIKKELGVESCEEQVENL